MSDHRPGDVSLSEVHRSVPIPPNRSWIRRMFAFAGPAYLVSVGYMDPGNWATDLAGGSRFGYQLVWVLVMSNLMAVLLQTLSARLGVVTGRDLAQACRDFYPSVVVFPLWILCEIAIIACDLAEVLGAAIGLKLLFGVPLLWGVLITAADVLLLLSFQRLGMRRLEAIIIVLVMTIGGCFALEMLFSRPDLPAILAAVIPRDGNGVPSLFSRSPHGGLSILGLDGESLYIAMGILGATVMPHNLYLHSSLVQSRAVDDSTAGKREACKMNLVDSVVALNAALFVNGAILVLAAAVFHQAGRTEVASLEEAHQLLAPMLGTALASTLFAVALLCAGQASTITGTLAGQIVMEGFLRIRVQPWLRRMISRGLAIIPAALVILFMGEQAVGSLLVLSQVVLSMQLAFAVIPLITFTSDRRRMGEFTNAPWVVGLSLLVASIIVILNAKLVIDTVGAWIAASGGAWWVWATAVPIAVGLAVMLLFIVFAPLLERRLPGLWPKHDTDASVKAVGSRETIAALPPDTEPLALQTAGYHRVAVALELGSADESVLAALGASAFHPDAELILIHVVESAASRYLGADAMDAESRSDALALTRLATHFTQRGVRARVRLGNGEATREIARIVAEENADLVITGSHGHTGLADMVYATRSRASGTWCAARCSRCRRCAEAERRPSAARVLGLARLFGQARCWREDAGEQ